MIAGDRRTPSPPPCDADECESWESPVADPRCWGFAIAVAPCACCHVPFGFNPLTVPSTTAFCAERQPVCAPCMQRVNQIRIDAGLEPFPIAPDAYEPAEASQL